MTIPTITRDELERLDNRPPDAGTDRIYYRLDGQTVYRDADWTGRMFRACGRTVYDARTGNPVARIEE